MAENSNIQWTDHTFNPWRGCTKVSEGCKNCYAETMSGRNPKVLGMWGPNGTRVVASEAMWAEPLKWNQQAKAWLLHVELCKQTGISDPVEEWKRRDNGNPPPVTHRPRVFCASLADVFEDWQGLMSSSDGDILHVCNACDSWRTMQKMCCGPLAHMPLVMADVRTRLFNLIDQTPYLDWLLLTKRPQNIIGMWPIHPSGKHQEGMGFKEAYRRDNVWIGCTVENQQMANERIPHLRQIPAKVRFLSVEPHLGPVDLANWLYMPCGRPPSAILSGHLCRDCAGWRPQIHWVICGGESGGNARPFNLDWARSLLLQCKVTGISFFMKQMGSHPTDVEHVTTASTARGQRVGLKLRDSKGGDPAEWPEDLRVREFPKGGA